MFGGILRTAGLMLIGFGGWILGSVYPAPTALVAMLGPTALQARAAAGLKAVPWESVQNVLSLEQRRAEVDSVLKQTSAAGRAIVVEQVTPAEVAMEAPEIQMLPLPRSIPVSTPSAGVAAGSFETAISLCPRMAVTNGPRADAAGHVLSYHPITTIQGIALAVDPTRKACVSSGFGERNGRLHRGVDYHSADGGQIMAAGDGVVLEEKYRDDYGNMLLIDHGHGVYTRYAHLAAFQHGLAVGSRVKAGDPIGLMGNTAAYPVPIHLHYEVLVGDYANPKASFGLTPKNPFGGGAAG